MYVFCDTYYLSSATYEEIPSELITAFVVVIVTAVEHDWIISGQQHSNRSHLKVFWTASGSHLDYILKPSIIENPNSRGNWNSERHIDVVTF